MKKNSFRRFVKTTVAITLAILMALTCFPVFAYNAEKSVTIFSADFEDGTTCGLMPMGDAQAKVVSDVKHAGNYALKLQSRTQTWNGPQFDLGNGMVAGNTYRFSVWVYADTASDVTVQLSFKVNEGDSYTYCRMEKISGKYWTKVEGKYTVADGENSIAPYIEIIDSLCDFYIDDLLLIQTGGYVADKSIETDIVSLKDEFAKINVKVGSSIGTAVMSDSTGNQKKLIKKHYDTIAIENQLKAQYTMDYATTISDVEKYDQAIALDFSAAIPFMEFAKENNMKVSAQALVWHSMTPDWFFYEGFDTTKSLASKEKMLIRMENYIKGVLNWCETAYPGIVESWIVVNESFDGDSNTHIRNNNNLWYTTIGDEYIAKAFEYANKYRPMNCRFLYNDYNMEASKTKTQYAIDYLTNYNVISNGWVDTIGFQCHVKMNWPGTSSIRESTDIVRNAGLSAEVTEIDIALGSSEIASYASTADAYRAQRLRYKEIIGAFLTAKDSGLNLLNITWWGLTDAYTWLTSQYNEAEYPQLFDANNKAKPAFYGVLDAINDHLPKEEAVDLAHGKATGDNGHQNDLVSSKAVDGDENSRWASNTSANGAEKPYTGEYYFWVQIGDVATTFNTIKIKWEDCYATAFKIQIKDSDPDENTGWTDVTDVLSAPGKQWQTIRLADDAKAKYVRLYITEKYTWYGCSIYEIGIFNEATDNLALGKPTGDNGHQGALVSSRAVDGNTASESRWASATSGDEFWFWVQLGNNAKTFNNVEIDWEACYAKKFKLQIKDSDPDVNTGWTDITDVLNAGGSGWQQIVFDNSVSAKYLRVYITEKATSYGCSFFEIVVNTDNVKIAVPKYEFIGEDDEEIPLSGDSSVSGGVSHAVAQFNDNKTNVRILAAVDSLDYSKAGFIVKAISEENGKGKEQEYADTNVYSAVSYIGGEITSSDIGIDNGYVFALVIKNVTGNVTFNVTPFAQLTDGRRAYGEIRYISVNDGELTVETVDPNARKVLSEDNATSTDIKIRDVDNDGIIRVACVGDSITAGSSSTNYPKHLQDLLNKLSATTGLTYQVTNHGKGGAAAHYNIEHLDADDEHLQVKDTDKDGKVDARFYYDDYRYLSSLDYVADVVIVQMGTNDALGNFSSYFEETYMAHLVEPYRAKGSTVIVSTSPYACNNWHDTNVNGPLRDLQISIAERNDLYVVDTNRLMYGHNEWSADGLHCNFAGYNIMAQNFYKYIFGGELITAHANTAPGALVTFSDNATDDKYCVIADENGIASYTFPVGATFQFSVSATCEGYKGTYNVPFMFKNDGDSVIIELEEGINIAPRGTTSQCDSKVYGNNDASNIIDGDTGTSSGYQPDSYKSGDWCALDFDKTYAVNQIVIYWETDSYIDTYANGGYKIYFKIGDYWVDQTSLSVSRAVSGQAIDVINIAPTNINGIKIEYLDGQLSGDNAHKFAPKLNELIVYGE